MINNNNNIFIRIFLPIPTSAGFVSELGSVLTEKVFTDVELVCLDGRNVEWVLQELGVRLHRTIYEHLMSFQFASAGAMTLICDMQEYRRCVADWKLPMVTQLFDTLHAMCNLLILPPENLRGAAMGDQLASMDKTILDNWLQCRVDYKTARLANCL